MQLHNHMMEYVGEDEPAWISLHSSAFYNAECSGLGSSVQTRMNSNHFQIFLFITKISNPLPPPKKNKQKETNPFLLFANHI